MENKKSLKIVSFTAAAILLVVATYFAASFYLNGSYQKHISSIDQAYQAQISSIQEQNLNFFKDYSVALNDIHRGSSYGDLASINLNRLNDYTTPKSTGYVYSYASNLADLGKGQAAKAKEYLAKSKSKLEAIKNSAPNNFFKEDVSNRIEQANYLIIYADQYYTLLDYTKQQLYEINYGSQAKAAEYLNKYNSLVLDVNVNLKKLSDIQNKIDVQWSQEWYPTFQEATK